MFDAQFIANPYPTYQHLLASGRLHWIEKAGSGLWFVPHYDDVMAIFRDPRVSTIRAITRSYPPEERLKLREIEQIMGSWMVSLDGQEHLRLRRLLNKAFTPQVIESLRPGIQRLADELIDEVQEQDSFECMSRFAHPLPALVIAQMLGVPREDRSKFLAWSADMMAFFTGMRSSVDVAYTAQAALVAMRDYFRPIVAERRQQPGDDLISLMIGVEEQGDILTEDQLLAQCTLFLFAGHETTRNLIGNGLFTLLRHPEQYTLLQQNPGLIRGAIDEMVRYESPLQLTSRVATEVIELHDQTIQPGQVFQLLIGAANRDPAVFPDPDRFDITRANSRPASFGFGPHACIGMQLAYLEAEIAITTLLRRLPQLRLTTDTADWIANIAFRGLRSLPLAFDPVQPRS